MPLRRRRHLPSDRPAADAGGTGEPVSGTVEGTPRQTGIEEYRLLIDLDWQKLSPIESYLLSPIYELPNFLPLSGPTAQLLQ